MSPRSDAVTLTLPRSAVGEVISLSASLVDRMHKLLERNTDGAVTSIEREELDTLVRMAHFAQILSMALQTQVAP